MDDCAFYNNQETEKRNNSTIVEQHQTNQQPAFTNELQLTWEEYSWHDDSYKPTNQQADDLHVYRKVRGTLHFGIKIIGRHIFRRPLRRLPLFCPEVHPPLTWTRQGWQA